MIYQMMISPASEEAPAFRIRFCSESFSLPGLSWPMELLNSVHFHHHFHQRGCSLKQREVIVEWIENPLTELCSVSREGEVHLLPSEEDVPADEQDEEADVWEEELPFGDDSFPR